MRLALCAHAAGRIVEHHPPLYDYGKYRDAGAFFEKELGVDKTTGFSLVRVAHHARPHVHVHEADGFLNFHRVATGAVRLFAEALLRAKLPAP